jgi:hypothetical protein
VFAGRRLQGVTDGHLTHVVEPKIDYTRSGTHYQAILVRLTSVGERILAR